MNFLLDWSEVWAVLIPLSVVLFCSPQPKVNRPIILYLLAAFVINLLANLIWKFNILTHDGYPYNGFLYNIHSIVRFLLFDIYFIRLSNRANATFSKIVRIAFGCFIVINFTFFETFYNPRSPFSSLLLSVEAVLLLVLCLQYYFFKFGSEEENRIAQPDFWMVTGLSIYVVVNFFIFLLYGTLARKSVTFAVNLWNIHNVSYIIFNLFIARALYGSRYGRH